MKVKKLDYSFFNRPTKEVAVSLIGKRIFFGEKSGIIYETEAYGGADDPASHAYRGPTSRSKIMFGEPGFSYVYLIYGIHHCLNFTSEKEEKAGAVLVRGVKTDDDLKLAGPGKICSYFNITREHNGIDITKSDFFYLTENDLKIHIPQATPRIGIKVGKDKLWRFIVDL